MATGKKKKDKKGITLNLMWEKETVRMCIGLK
jgi:hypothetical protein